MRITSVALENIKSYSKITVPFSNGTIAIRGHNGAGKSTLVEAIGFALFDSINYSQDQFVREGERYGVVTVSFISAEDDREYQAVRRCGSSPTWFIYDPELQTRVVEQKADVNDFLRRHLRLETNISLRDLFNDALGVPQGTFTADFLLTPANRKKKFDALLQVEDYQKAAEKLRETRSYLQEERRSVERRIADLERETNQLDGWRAALVDLHEQERLITARLQDLQREVAAMEQRRDSLRAQRDTVQKLKSAADLAAAEASAAEQRLHAANALLDAAREAVRICDDASADYQRYLAAQRHYDEATKRARERDELRQQRAAAAAKHAAADRDLHNARAQLDAAHQAAQRIVALLPNVDRQEALERQQQEAERRSERYDDVTAQRERAEQMLRRLDDDIAACERAISALELHRAEASLLDERREHVTMLQDQRARQSERKKRLGKITAEQQEAATLREKAAANEARLQENVRKIRANQAVAESLPALEDECRAIEDKLRRIEARREQHERSREASGGGNCPFLQEPCLNIQRKGMSSLSGYFDKLIVQEEKALATAREELAQAAAQRDHARTVREYYDKLDLYEQRLQDASEQRRAAEKRLAQLAAEQQEIEYLEGSSPSAGDLAEAQKLFKRSDEADKKLRELEPRRDELARLKTQHAETTGDIARYQQELAALEPARAALEQLKAELAALGDPRAERTGLQRIASEQANHEASVGKLERQVRELAAQLDALDTALEPYSGLDGELEALRGELEQAQPGHQRYLQYEKVAESLPARQADVASATKAAQTAQAASVRATKAFEAAGGAFDEAALVQAEARCDELKHEDGRKREELRNKQEDSKHLADEIARVEMLLTTLESERQEFSALEDLEQMLQQFRDTIKEAGPNIMKALLREISARANTIFGEIMGDRSAELAWTNDYEIVLRRDGQERSFAQLSGGEQMSAALAVRLALLRHLTRLDIAFFDEPTQNMDGERRVNLAEQIRRVRGFDQLIVISHDDTFEQGLDSVIHLEKRNGKTVLAEIEDDLLVPA